MLAEIFGVDGIVVAVIVLAVLFGGAAIPKLARNLGSAKNQFEKGLQEGKQSSAVEVKNAHGSVPTVDAPATVTS